MLLRSLSKGSPGEGYVQTDLAVIRSLLLDFNTPAAMAYQGEASDWTDLGHPSPDHLWMLDGPTGTQTDKVGSHDLDTLAAGVVFSQTFVGHWNGTDYVSQQAMGIPNTNSGVFASTAGADLDLGVAAADTCVAIAIRFRSARPDSTSRAVITKTDAGQVGYILLITPTGGLTLRMDDGPNVVNLNVPGNYADGAIHEALIIMDRADDSAYIYTDLENGTASFAAVTGALSAANGLGVGFKSGIVNSSPDLQVLRIAAWSTAVNARAMIDTAIPAALLATGLQSATGDLLTFARASVATAPVGNNSTDGDFLGYFASGAMCLEHNAGLANTNSLGARFSGIITNLFPESRDFSGWSVTGGLVVDSEAHEGPDGFKLATLITQAADTERAQQQITGLTASTEYTFSMWVKPSGGAHSIQMDVYDAANAVELASATPTAAIGWARYSVTFTTAVGETTAWLRFLPAAVGFGDEAAYVYAPQVNTDDYAKPWIPTEGASASSVATDCYVDSAAGLYIKGDQGEIEITHILDDVDSSAARILLQCKTPANTFDERTILFQTDQKHQFYVYDAAGALHESVKSTGALNPTFEIRGRFKWRSTRDLPTHTENIGVLDDPDNAINLGSAGTWTTTDTITRLVIGSIAGAGSNHCEGLIAQIQIFHKPRPDSY